jgi:soluble lytic murein transglycosylase
MQVMPATGRMYARRLGMRPFTTASLLQPEANVRIGVRYLKDLMDRFGGVHYALAGYNAGDSRVAAWIAENPGLPPDEFIDSIPFPETQNYVKRIVGTTEDYRRLYGSRLPAPGARPASVAD